PSPLPQGPADCPDPLLLPGSRWIPEPGPCPSTVSLVGAQVTYESVEVPENKRATIPCSAYEFGLKNPRIEWKFQKGSSLVFLYYQGELMEPYKDRIQFSPSNIVFLTVTRADTGRYICEVVEDGSKIAKSEVNLIVQVPPSKPVAHVPTSATISSKVVLRCTETDGSPPPTFRWYKDGMLLPTDPKSSPSFRNSSYSLDTATGELVFQPLSSSDSGDYSCEASNNVGSPQRSDAIHMEATEVNVGGIVAAVVVLLMVLALAAFGVWFAYSRGFFSTLSSIPERKEPLGRHQGLGGGGGGGVCSVSHLPVPFSSCSTTGKKVIYSQPSHRSQGEFKQTSSFLV
ncbi:junctional adhesion molecule A, partial [Guaruba guarouba]